MTAETIPHPLTNAHIHDHRITWRATAFPCRAVTPRGTVRGAPILVLSGGLQNRHSWTRLERHLAACHPLIIPDLPPAHSPGRATLCLSWEDLTDAAVRAVDQLGADRFAVLAVSSGYPIGYRLAQRHPDRVARLLLFGASPRPGPRLTELIKEGLRRENAPLPATALHSAAERRTAAKELVGVLTNTQAAQHHVMMKAAARVLADQLSSSQHDPLVRYVLDRGALLLHTPLPPGGLTGVPALVGVGEYDTATTVADNRAVAATISGAAFVVMQHADHLLHMERDTDFATLISHFLHGGRLDDLPHCTTETLP